jgi:DNA-directed RNA polymerase specialized sigma24 family protein
MLIEIYCRLLGSWDYYIKGKNPFAWEIAVLQKNCKDQLRIKNKYDLSHL